MKLSERFVPDLLRPKWRCATCGKTYWRNQRRCRNCDATVFERVR